MFPKSNHKTLILGCILAIFMIAGIGAGLYFANQDIDHLREHVVEFLTRARESRWSFPLTVGVYVIAEMMVFPITVLNLATSMVFGPFWGFVYGLAGSLASASVLFTIGSLGRHFGLREIFSGPRMKKIDQKIGNAGVLGIAMLGFVPIAPYSFVALCAGLSSVHFLQFISGVFLALLPGGIARSVLGDSLMKIFLDPNAQTFAYVGAGLALWVTVLLSVHFGLKKYTAHHAVA